MNPPNTVCDEHRLQLLLQDQLPEEAARETTEHLNICPACREALDRLAGAPEWWDEVQDSLRLAATDSGILPTQLEADGPDSGPDSHWHLNDFAVDYLEPCEQPGTIGRVGEIEILEVIGRGGMGVILKGYQRDLGRYVAVKMMAPHLAAVGSARRRFEREARAAAAIVHPHVMPIHAVNAAARLPYLVMPYLDCESLQQRIDRAGPLGLAELLRIGHQTAAGLAAAHAQGLVHRDVKPANILLERGVDRVLLTDFGLARAADDASLTRTGTIAGTPQFMSPEQARGDVLDHRTDLFSLGSVLYAMAAGRPPFRAETSYGILRRITDTQPHPLRELNPEIPAWLESFVARLLDKEPARRFDAAADVALLLEQSLAHLQQPTAVPLPAALRTLEQAAVPPRRGRPRMPALWWAAIPAVVVGLFALLAVWPATNSPDAPSDKAATAGTSGSTAAVPETPPVNDLTWDDFVDEDLESIADRLGTLENEDTFWNPPSSAAPLDPLPQE